MGVEMRGPFLSLLTFTISHGLLWRGLNYLENNPKVSIVPQRQYLPSGHGFDYSGLFGMRNLNNYNLISNYLQPKSKMTQANAKHMSLWKKRSPVPELLDADQYYQDDQIDQDAKAPRLMRFGKRSPWYSGPG